MNNFRKVKLTIVSISIAAAIIAASVAGLSASSVASPAAPAVVDANAIYAAKCQKCHGADGKGVPKYKKSGQKDFTDAAWQKSESDAKLTAAINKGKGDFMPGFKGKLTPEEIKALVGKVRAFKK